jgi:uridine kinase
MLDKLIISHVPDLFERLTLPLSIGIVGESASGKSTITEDFINVLNNHNISTTRINTDDYYFDNSEAVKEAGSFAAWAKDKDLDSPEAMELSLMKSHIQKLKQGCSVYLPKYDMSGTAIRCDNHTLAKPSDIIISEGLFTMCVQEVFDITIYIDIPKHIQKERWYARAIHRNLGDSMDVMFERANIRADQYIRPFKNICDVIISGQGPRPKYKQLMEKLLIKIKEGSYEYI